jgi:hypothetical protein
MLGERQAGRSGEADNEDEKVAAVHNLGQTDSLAVDDFPRQVDVAAAAQSMDRFASDEMPVRHDRTLDGLLVGIEDPDVLPRTAVQHDLVADRGAGLAETDDAHTIGEEGVCFFREGSVGGEFDHDSFSPVR